MQMAVFEWTVAQGLMRSPDSPDHRWQNEYAPPGAKRGQVLPKTAEPLDMLRHIQDINFKAIYWLKDFAPHLTDPVVARQFREVTAQFSHHRSTLVISGSGPALPPEIAHDAVYFDLKLPDPEELYTTVSEVVRALKGRVNVELTPEDIRALVKALQGMTLSQTRKVVSYAALQDGKLNAEPDASTTSTWASQTRTVAAPLPWPRPWLPAFSGSTKSKKAWAKPAVRPMVD
jgi:hypothetical protein